MSKEKAKDVNRTTKTHTRLTHDSTRQTLFIIL
jgi:hypothetical protein